MSKPLSSNLGFRFICAVAMGWCAALLVPARAQSLTITTVATLPGAGAGAVGMVADSAGNFYFSESNNFTIRKVTPAGVVTTVAGAAGVSGYVDASGTSARFRRPGAIVRDASGNLYVGDGARVRKITPAGAVTTLIAQGVLAGAPAASETSAFALNGAAVWGFGAGVSALALDAANNLYVAEYYSIRKIGVDGRDSTIAGQPFAQGAADGVGANARFGFINALALDASGNLYASDGINLTIRKISPTGVVTTLAGLAGSAGFVDGPGGIARFASPNGLALDSSGNLFVSANGGLRRISLSGIVTTVAGGPGLPEVFGPDGWVVFGDGIGSLARFANPGAIVIDSAGAVFVSDGATIRKGVSVPVPAKIVVSPSAQTSPAGQRATFSIVANGNPAVTYRWQRQAAASGAWTDVSDGSVFSGATTATLAVSSISLAMDKNQFRCVATNSLGSDVSAAAALAVDPPVIVVPLRVATLAGKAGTSAGATDGAGSAARFTVPMGLTSDAAGNLYVADTFGNRIRKVTPGGSVTTLAGSGTQGALDGVGTAAQFGQPGALTIDGVGNLFVADTANSMIRKISPAGAVTRFAGGSGVLPPVNLPRGIVLDRSGNLIVVGSDDTLMLQITPAGVITPIPIQQNLATTGISTLRGAAGLAFDAAGNLYIANSDAHTVCRLDASGAVTVVAGRTGSAGSVDGRALNARFNYPSGLAIDVAGNIYVADTGNHTIRKISPAGLVSTVAGIAPSAAFANSAGATDGIGSAARFNQPRGLVIDRSGTLFIADSLNNTIRQATTDGVSAGDPVVFSVLTVGETGPVAYQWRKNSVAITGATGELFSIPAASVADVGDYSVEVSTADGGVVSAAVTLTIGSGGAPVVTPSVVTPPVVTPPVVPPAPASRIVNLSIRSSAGQGAATLAVGFVISGRLPLLVRGVGPTLAKFGVATALADPRLSLYSGDTLNVSNDNWVSSSDLRDAVTRLGAFALSDGSLDAALLTSLEAGAFTAQCTGANGSNGIALVELYDAATGATAAAGRLINVSARSQVGAGEGILIAGFSISGTAPRSVLIRGVGPALAQFGVGGALADPQLRLLDESGALKAQNDNWADNGFAPVVALAGQTVGAFALPDASKDSSVVATLTPGTYSVQLSGVGGGTGVALIEIYELP